MAPTDLTDATFGTEIEAHRGLAVVDFWAAWCGPCRMIAPMLEQLAVELAGKVKVAKLDVDGFPETAESFGVRAIPTLLVFRDGKLVDRVVGVVPKHELSRRLEAIGTGAVAP